MDYSKERSVKFLRGAAQLLSDENRRLRQERAAVEAELARERAERDALAAEAERLRELKAELERLEALQAEVERLRAERATAELAAEVARAERATAELKAELAEAERATAELATEMARAERAATEAELAEAERQRAELAERLAALEAELASVRELLALRERHLYGKKTERRPPTEPTEGTSEAEPKAKKKKKKQKGHGPSPQPDLPVVEVVHSLAGPGLACEHCGGELETLGAEAEKSELIALEARRVVLERHIRMKYQCPCCKTGVKTAPGPVKLVPGGRYALSFTIDVAFYKYLGHMPLARQAGILRHEGLYVTTAALCDQMDELATLLTPTHRAIEAAVQSESVLRADETPWAVLANGHSQNERFYAWAVVGSQYVVYRLLDTRSKEGAATVLGEFSGTLMVDGLTSYPAAAKGMPGQAPRFKVANCHAHARRKFVECEAYAPVESAFAVELYRKLYEIEREGKEPGADLGALRRDLSRPLVDELFAWAKAQQARPNLLPSSGLAKALAYLVNHEAGLRVFLDDAAVPIDNNESERAMRSPVLGRKNFYGSRSRRATENAAVFYTLIESAKRVGVSPKAYLEAAAEHALRKAGAVLLPDEFKRQLDAARESNPPTP